MLGRRACRTRQLGLADPGRSLDERERPRAGARLRERVATRRKLALPLEQSCGRSARHPRDDTRAPPGAKAAGKPAGISLVPRRRPVDRPARERRDRAQQGEGAVLRRGGVERGPHRADRRAGRRRLRGPRPLPQRRGARAGRHAQARVEPAPGPRRPARQDRGPGRRGRPRGDALARHDRGAGGRDRGAVGGSTPCCAGISIVRLLAGKQVDCHTEYTNLVARA